MYCSLFFLFFFFFNDTSTTDIYTLSLHDALPISGIYLRFRFPELTGTLRHVRMRSDHIGLPRGPGARRDRKSTRLNSSHMSISYAVFCLKKKKKKIKETMKKKNEYILLKTLLTNN